MDWNIWDSTYQDTLEDADDYTQYGGTSDLLFDPQYDLADVIEENALNEKSCIQVLNILIPKADAEIEELQQNLVLLQTELACIEDEEWPEICCNALREKISDLEASVRSLRSKPENATLLRLSMPWKPAEKIEDILKDLLRKHFRENDKQHPDFVPSDLKSDSLADTTEHAESSVQGQLESEFAVKESGETISPVEGCTSDHQSTDYALEIKPAPKNTEDPGQSLIVICDSSDEKKRLVTADSSELTRQFEATEQEPVSMDAETKESESLNDEDRKSPEPAVATVEDSSLGSVNFSKECVNVVKSLCKSDVKASQSTEVTTTATKQDSVAAKDLQPEGDQTHERVDEPPNGIMEHTSPYALINTATVNVRNPIPQSQSSTSRKTDAGDGDLDEKLAELKRKTTKKEGTRELKIVIGKTTTKSEQPDLKGMIKADRAIGKPEPDKSPKAAVIGFGTSHLNSDQIPQLPSAKRKSERDSESMKGQVVASSKRKPSTSSLSTLQKTDIIKDSASLNEVIVKNSKKLHVPKPFAKEHNASIYLIEHPLAQPQGSKRILNLPVSAKAEEQTVDLKFPDRHRNVTNSDSASSNPINPIRIPYTSDDLNKMKVHELRTLAKERSIVGCSKMKKQDLVARILAKQQENSQA